ncbi:uncharacterized protein si:dkey-154b15.1 isoform X2 [Gymnodraco acuticeps]|uniref:Uncharacterized protein si:dkey-154b15.1 isoform X2 n=1 Tax=Gymnodraco acuticeps TaxID=8218 RepID=A0A6P8WWF2_GYMAC|nr:uncharacterized protein si:dkey-154b15.1 isoform X2 [Gymnodraco acuticeps]
MLCQLRFKIAFFPTLSQMDLPVEATVHLNLFPNEAEVIELLQSHGFSLTYLSQDQVRVKGSFLKLKAVKASLEQIVKSDSKTDIVPVPKASYASSGAVSKHYPRNSSVSNANRSRDKPPYSSPSSPSSSSPPSSPNKLPSSQYKASPSPEPDQRSSFSPRSESFIVDEDVFRYADRLRKRDIDGIVECHNVRMVVVKVGDSASITLHGKSARTAVGKLQSLLDDLNQSLRTQEVLLKDMDQEGRVLLEKIKKDRNIYNSVLVCPMDVKLRLIGPSRESHDLKHILLRRQREQSRHPERTSVTIENRRSSSLPPVSHKNARDRGGVDTSYPYADEAGYSPSRYQDEELGAAGCFGGASMDTRRPESRRYAPKERVQKEEEKSPKSPKKAWNSLKGKFISLWKKKR